MKVLILAAGMGSRLKELIKEIPKCLLKEGDKTLLERQIEVLEEFSIKKNDVILVIGKEGDCWNEENIQKIKNIHDNILINPINSKTSPAYSLRLGLEGIDKGPVLILDGDLFLGKNIYSKILNNQNKSCLLTKFSENKREEGNRVMLKKDRVRAIGRDVISENIYMGVIMIGDDFLDDFKKELEKDRYLKDETSIALNELCKDAFIYNITLHKKILGDQESRLNFLEGGSYASTKKEGKIVRKEAAEGKDKIANEIRWLLNLPEDIKDHFPRIIDYNLETNPVFFEMEYYDFPTLRRLLLENNINAKKAISILKNIMDFMFEEIYSRNKTLPKNNFVQKLHFQKIKDRLEESKRKSKLFDKLILAKKITLNGKTMENILPLIDKLEKNKNLIEHLMPKYINMFHGDLHFDNILVDTSNGHFILIDPRGSSFTGEKECDYTYDLAKLWHSFHGLYDFLHEGKFSLDINFDGVNVNANLKIENTQALEEYKKICKAFPKLLASYNKIREDRYWELRTDFTEAMHFCSVAPFHLRGTENEEYAVALYLTGLKLLNEFIEKWLTPKIEDLIVNINRIEDYEFTRQLIEDNIANHLLEK